MTDSTGQVIVGYEYDAFGAQRLAFGTLTNDFRFTEQQLDSEASLYYMRARWYDPSVGRFITRDPIGVNYANPQSINRYVYVRNNPLRYVDPSGEDLEDAVRFLQGVSNQWSYNNSWFVPGAQEAWGTRPDEAWSMTLGRHFGNAFSMLQGVGEVTIGGGAAGGGVVSCATGVGCLAGAPAVAVGATAMAHGGGVGTSAASQEGRMLGDLIVAFSGHKTINTEKGPLLTSAGRESTAKYVQKNWDKGTFDTCLESAA